MKINANYSIGRVFTLLSTGPLPVEIVAIEKNITVVDLSKNEIMIN